MDLSPGRRRVPATPWAGHTMTVESFFIPDSNIANVRMVNHTARPEHRGQNPESRARPWPRLWLPSEYPAVLPEWPSEIQTWEFLCRDPSDSLPSEHE